MITTENTHVCPSCGLNIEQIEKEAEKRGYDKGYKEGHTVGKAFIVAESWSTTCKEEVKKREKEDFVDKIARVFFPR